MASDLAGLLVVSIEQAVAPTYLSCKLADAGARVIKIERPEGDFARHYDHLVHGESAYFVWLNRGKESICLDLKQEGERAILSEMIARADIFIQNLAPGAIERLMRDAETEREGALTRRLTAVVSGTACARVARRLGLGPALRLAGSTASQGGRDNDTILGDAMEALMAAIYLDGGLEAARRVFDLGWSEELAVEAEPEREPKTALQEWAMARKLPLPAYEVVGRHGPDHAPMFKVEVQVQGFPPAQAEGRSRQLAEKAAAQALLSRETTHG